ncbi:hypothetical protein H206_01936 [Candidatus Electrothrix aarhusensis]|uniref:Uncharacterized protein n=1 Tax=Candidatus Electrothrix aarhusensis TaxID=1859131 RepID=A0A3S3U9C3_9BACT|nr:hypothetical protein H206_01936 [Candidatus Electrothrix aarhusensis]
MDKKEYYKKFREPSAKENKNGVKEAESRAGRALDYALDIRKFEIDLYWKRATYFWAFIAASFAGYALTYKNAATHEPWLTLLFSSLGLVFSFTWYLVNRGSKFWQNNWERHVDLLEDITIGPLYKIVASNREGNPLTSAGRYSVTKLNQILSVFVTLIWALLFLKSIGPIDLNSKIDIFKIVLFILTVTALFILWKLGRTRAIHGGTSKLDERTFDIET